MTTCGVPLTLLRESLTGPAACILGDGLGSLQAGSGNRCVAAARRWWLSVFEAYGLVH